MPRYLPGMNDTSRYSGGFQLGDGKRTYPSTSSGSQSIGSTKSK